MAWNNFYLCKENRQKLILYLYDIVGIESCISSIIYTYLQISAFVNDQPPAVKKLSSAQIRMNTFRHVCNSDVKKSYTLF